jgi:hypothetical protein
MDVQLGRSELQLIVDALDEYAEACRLAAEMAVGRDEELRIQRAQESAAAQRLREAIRQSAA